MKKLFKIFVLSFCTGNLSRYMSVGFAPERWSLATATSFGVYLNIFSQCISNFPDLSVSCLTGYVQFIRV